MEQQANYYTPNSIGGWTCMICGQWIPDGTTHNCPGNLQQWQPQPQYYYVGSSDNELLKKIIELLEKIYEKL